MAVQNKGQSALEYLMTYGWALIVIVVVIAVLVGMQPKVGVTCNGFGGKMTIKSSSATTGGVDLAVLNGTGKSLTGVIFGGSFKQGSSTYAITSTVGQNATVGGTVTSGTMAPVGGTLTSGNVIVDLNVSYNDGDLTHVEQASCTGQL